MSLRRPTDRLAAAPWARVFAVVCALLVMLLGAAAHSPALHDGLHHLTTAAACDNTPHSHDDSSATTEGTDAHDCAVTLFAQGLLHAVALPVARPEVCPAFASDRPLPDSTSHLLPWSQAPPASC